MTDRGSTTSAAGPSPAPFERLGLVGMPLVDGTVDVSLRDGDLTVETHDTDIEVVVEDTR